MGFDKQINDCKQIRDEHPRRRRDAADIAAHGQKEIHGSHSTDERVHLRVGYAVVYQTTELPGSKPRDEGKEEEHGKRLHECRDDAGYIYYARDGAFDEIVHDSGVSGVPTTL